jgi:hypothetical protein
MSAAGKQRMRDHFTFGAQAAAYVKLFQTLCSAPLDVPA